MLDIQFWITKIVEHPTVLPNALMWLMFFLIPYTIVRIAAAFELASRTGSFHWIYKPIRQRICQRIPGFIHAVWMTYLGGIDWVNNGYTFKMLVANNDLQEYILALSLPYLAVDLILDVIRGPEFMYFFHHFLLIICFCSCIFESHRAAGTVITWFVRAHIHRV